MEERRPEIGSWYVAGAAVLIVAKALLIVLPRYTTKRVGIGMGLAIARTIVGAHGGRRTADDNADGGATFRFVLPVDEAAVR